MIDVEIKLAEKADHSPKDRFAACSTLDRAVYRLAGEQRAASIQPPTMHAIHERCGALCLYTNTHIMTVAVTKATGWRSAADCCCIPLRLVVLLLCMYSSGCGAAVLKTSSRCIGPLFLVRMIRRQVMARTKTTKTYTRLVARPNPHVTCTATYTGSFTARPAAASCCCC